MCKRTLIAGEKKKKKFRERLRNPVETVDAGYDAERYLDENKAWEIDK